MKFRNLTIRSNKPSVFQSQTMSAAEFGETGTEHLLLTVTDHAFQVDAVHSKGHVTKTALFNRDDVAEIYGDRTQ